MPHDASARLRIVLAAGALVLGLGSCLSPKATHTTQDAPRVRLYLLDGGTLIATPTNYGLTREEVRTDTLSVLSYLVVHPRGTLLWDTGVVPDSFVGSNRPGANRTKRTLKSQLAEIGYTQTSITYLALSHLHSDHSANANDYATSTWLVREAERNAMFGATAYPSYNVPAYYSALRNAKTVLVERDYDVFGDGSVVIKAAPGHTPGHQVLFVNLAQTGPIVLSGDLYHFPEQRVLNRLAKFDFDQNETRASRAALDTFMTRTAAVLWIQHDFVANARRKKSPAYYE